MRAKWSMLFGPEGAIILWPKGAILFSQRGQICLAFPLQTEQGKRKRASERRCRLGYREIESPKK